MDPQAEFDRRYRAVMSRDRRFDGYFFVGVTSTGVYCRPSCPSRTPGPGNVRFFPTAAAAQAAGFRACKRCIPGAVPGSPEWDLRGDTAGRAMHLIADGVVEREGVPGLASRLGYSERQLRRVLDETLGAGPLALARAQRAHVARLLLETTDLSVTEIAFAAGFGSLRQANATIKEVFDAAPLELRDRARRRDAAPTTATHAAGAPASNDSGSLRLELKLSRRDPFDWPALLEFLGPRSIPGVEEVVDEWYRRALCLPHGPAVAEVTDDGVAVRCRLALADPQDLAPAVARVRHLLDLDADPEAVAESLGRDPVIGALVGDRPGRRSPGAADGPELAIRAVIGQQVAVASARTVAGRLVERHGVALREPVGGVTHAFPEPAALAAADPATMPMPAARSRTIVALSEEIASGRLDLGPGADRVEAQARLRAIAGVGPWTAGYVAMRALADPDVLLADDLGVRHGLRALGEGDVPADIRRLGDRWSPWRSYAVHHIWAAAPAARRPASPARGGAIA